MQSRQADSDDARDDDADAVEEAVDTGVEEADARETLTRERKKLMCKTMNWTR